MVELLPPVVHGQVLVTSRDTAGSRYATLAELEVFDPQEAVRSCWPAPAAATRTAAAAGRRAAGWLPLALEQAGAYVRGTLHARRLPGPPGPVPCADFGRGRPRDRDPARHCGHHLAGVPGPARPVPGAAALLEVCAFLAPEEIRGTSSFSCPTCPPRTRR